MGPPVRRRVRAQPGCGFGPKSTLVALPELRRDLGIARSLGRTLPEFYDLPDEERGRQVAAWEIEKDRCPTHGGPFSECPDAVGKDWFPQRRICWPAAQLAVAERLFDDLHGKAVWHDGSFTVFADEFSAMTPWHVRDGMTVYLAEYDENPGDLFTTDKFAKPAGLPRLGVRESDEQDPGAGSNQPGA